MTRSTACGGPGTRFGQDRRAAATGVAAVAATLTLGLQPGRAADPWMASGSRSDFWLRGARSCTTVFGGSSPAFGSPSRHRYRPAGACVRRRLRVAPSPAAESSSPLSSSPRRLGILAVASAGRVVAIAPSAALLRGHACGRGDRGGACGWPGVSTAHRRRPGHRCRRPLVFVVPVVRFVGLHLDHLGRRTAACIRAARRGGFQHQPRFGLGRVRPRLSAASSPVGSSLANQHIADAGLRRSDRRWTARSGCARRVRSARRGRATGGAEHPRQRVHPQPVGKVLPVAATRPIRAGPGFRADPG